MSSIPDKSAPTKLMLERIQLARQGHDLIEYGAENSPAFRRVSNALVEVDDAIVENLERSHRERARRSSTKRDAERV